MKKVQNVNLKFVRLLIWHELSIKKIIHLANSVLLKILKICQIQGVGLMLKLIS